MKSFLIAAGTALLFSTAAHAADVAAELATAEMHAGLAAKAADMTGAQKHLHHTLNCLVGAKGTGYDAAAGNPCQNSGDGLLVDTTDAAKLTKLQAAQSRVVAGLSATALGDAQTAATDAQKVLAEAK
jgi:hypothetical protein